MRLIAYEHNKAFKIAHCRSLWTRHAAGHLMQRVCRAWHRTREVEVLSPGVRRAEG